jgi:hypothetical protein
LLPRVFRGLRRGVKKLWIGFEVILGFRGDEVESVMPVFMLNIDNGRYCGIEV